MPARNPRVTALYGLFAVSGFCGLIYESIWSHYLKLFVGHAAYAQTLVLAVFMGGMGLGAWLVARLGGRWRNLLWGYAAVELLIGAMALGFHPAFGAVTAWAYDSLLPAACAAEGFCAVQGLLAVALILPQSVLLGTTFPLMTGGILRLAPDLPGRRLALLYFLNSLGAVAGVLASGFVLIPWVGLPGTLLTAGLGNVLLAVLVYFLGKPPRTVAPADRVVASPEAPVVASVASPPPAVPAVPAAALLLVAAFTGLSSFIYEVAWIRMLSMVFGSATHSFEIMLASFILGLALGGWWVRRRNDDSAGALPLLARVQLAMGMLALLTLPLYGLSFDAMGWLMSGLARNGAGYVLFTLALNVLALVVMLPATFCAGMTLPLITGHLYRQGGERAIGQVYAANTLGSIAGVLLAVHVLLPAAGLEQALVIGAGIDLALGAWLLAQARGQGTPVGRAGWAWLSVAAGLLVAVPLATHFDPLKMAAGVFRDGRVRLDASTQVVHAQDGKTATVHALRFADGNVMVATNGKPDGTARPAGDASGGSDELTMTLLGALPLVYRPDATEVAVIGFGTGMSSATLLGSPRLQRLDTIEIEPAMVAASQHFRPLNERAYADPRHRLVFDDAKSTFARGQRRYDAIVSEPSNPWVSGVSSLFTEEFYAQVRRHLKDDGVLVQWLHAYEITPELAASVFTALQRSFAVYDVYMGTAGDLVIVAGPGPSLPLRSAAVFGMPAVRAALERVGLGSEQHLALQWLASQRALAPLITGHAMPPNSDYFPLVDIDGPRARFMRSSIFSWTQLHATETPLLRALDGAPRVSWSGEVPASERAGHRQIAYLRARQALAYVQHGTRPVVGRDFIGAAETLRAVRQRLFACGPAGPGAKGDAAGDGVPWETVLRWAAETLPLLDEAEAGAFWDAATASRCTAALPPGERRWLELLTHLAHGRWREAGVLAAAALQEPGLSAGLGHTMLTQVAVTSHLLAGSRADARRRLDIEGPRLAPADRDKPWVRLLVAHVQGW